MQSELKVVQVAIVQYEHDPRSILRCATEISKHFQTYLISRGDAPKAAYKHLKVSHFKSVLLRALLVHPIVFWHCLRLKADLYHFHNPELIPLFLVLKMLGKKIVFDVHENVEAQLSSRDQNSGPIYRRLFKFFNQKAKDNFNLILAEDSYLKDYEDAKGELAIVHNYPDTSTIRPVESSKPSQRNSLFYIGGIGLQRGLGELIKASSILGPQIEGFKLHLVGPIYEEQQTIQNLDGYAEALPYIEFHGPLEQSEAFTLCSTAIAGLALLADSPNYRESYPSKIFEYMALALPFIYTGFPLYREVAQGAGLAIEANSSRELVEAVLKIYKSQGLWQEMSAAGLAMSKKKYNWALEKENLLSFYSRLGLAHV